MYTDNLNSLGTFGFNAKSNVPPSILWGAVVNIVESGVKHHQTNKQNLFYERILRNSAYDKFCSLFIVKCKI